MTADVAGDLPGISAALGLSIQGDDHHNELVSTITEEDLLDEYVLIDEPYQVPRYGWYAKNHSAAHGFKSDSIIPFLRYPPLAALNSLHDEFGTPLNPHETIAKFSKVGLCLPTMDKQRQRKTTEEFLCLIFYPLADLIHSADGRRRSERVKPEGKAVDTAENVDTMRSLRDLCSWLDVMMRDLNSYYGRDELGGGTTSWNWSYNQSYYVYEGYENMVSALCARACKIAQKCKGLRDTDTASLICQQANYCLQRRYQCNLSYPEKLCSHAIPILEDMLGKRNPETINCQHVLARILVNAFRYQRALTLYQEILKSELAVFGEKVEELAPTMKYIADIAMRYKNWQDAGRIMWAIRHAAHQSNIPPNIRLGYDRENQLSGASPGYVWESEALQYLPLRRITFRAVYPSGNDRWHYWSAAYTGEPYLGNIFTLWSTDDSDTDAPARAVPTTTENMKYAFENAQDEFVDLEIPYIPYSHFMQSTDRKHMLLYTRYIRPSHPCSCDIPVGPPKWFSAWAGKYNKYNIDASDSTVLQFPLLDETGLDISFPPVKGFFNGIPADAAFVHNGNSSTMLSNFVSSAWVDYKQFTVHEVSSELMPQLRSEDGQAINCHGYISGSWTDFAVEFESKGIMLFVVDALFRNANCSNDCYFLLSKQSLESPLRQEVPWFERRQFCARLNPSLCRYTHECMHTFGISQKQKRKGGLVAPEPKPDADLWKEMTRRAEWDRNFEAWVASDRVQIEEKKTTLEKENRIRKEWDLKFMTIHR